MEQYLTKVDWRPLYVRDKYVGETYITAFRTGHSLQECTFYDISMKLCYTTGSSYHDYIGKYIVKYMVIDEHGIYFMDSLPESEWYPKVYIIENLSISKDLSGEAMNTLHIRARVLELEKVYADDPVYKPLPGNVTVKERKTMKNGICGTKVGYAIFDECGVYDKLVRYMPKVKKIIFSEPATVVLWGDGSKTVVKCNVESEPYDKEKGLAMCIAERYFGNYTKFKKAMKEAEEDAE